MRKLIQTVLAGLLGVLGLADASLAAAAPARQKVVYHISDAEPEQQRTALRNIQNHILAVGGENLDVRVVLQGNGVSLLLLPEALPAVHGVHSANATSVVQMRIDDLKIQGVVFEVCANSLERRGIDGESQLYGVEKADIVPSGLGEIVRLQSQGYTYIKP